RIRFYNRHADDASSAKRYSERSRHPEPMKRQRVKMDSGFRRNDGEFQFHDFAAPAAAEGSVDT
ncbi:MAG: hypothetical protein L6Q71_11900, partial [Planctomycetes bacterium]|nr:hypothetical protein [Planctomycetota bacterium]